MNAEIITVGTELLRGDIANSNSQFLSHELATFGIHVTHLTTVDDDFVHLRESLRHALGRTELVILSGDLEEGAGIRAREALSDVLDTPLELHTESWERIREYFLNTCREMPENSQSQAMLPQGCTVFPNDHGTAPGCAVTRYEQQILLLPGTPRELYPMYSDYVAPFLSNLVGGTTVSRTVGVFGLSEAVLNERLADLMSEANPSVAAYSKDGEAILRVTAHAADRKAALALCEPVIEEIRNRLSVNVYGVDIGSLQKAVVVLLLDKHMKIATAESCTAGLLSGRLTEVSGASAVFECGVAAYSKEIKHNILGVPMDIIDTYGTVSPEVARAMAVGVRRVGNAALGISITGVAGPDISEGKPVGTVYIALADEKRVWVKKIETKEGTVEREYVRSLATSYALDLARRYLEALPTVMAGGEIIEPETIASPTIPEGVTTKTKFSILHHIFPWKGDRKIDVVRKSAILAAFLILLAALFSIVYMRVLRPLDNITLYNNLKSMFSSSNSVIPVNDMNDYPEGILTQFCELYSRNRDVRGWINIDGTNINYPVMSNSNNGYYKNRNFYRQVTDYGTPYFISNTSLQTEDFFGRSMVIYGNTTKDGQMFSELANYYKDIEFLRTHPIIEMDTLFRVGKWKVFSVMVVKGTDASDASAGSNAFNYKQTVFADEADFLSFTDKIKERSFYTFPAGQAGVQEGDSIVLLSTDFPDDAAGFKNAKLIVAARRIRSGELETADYSEVSYNSNPVLPLEWKENKKSESKHIANTTTASSKNRNVHSSSIEKTARPIGETTRSTSKTTVQSKANETTKPTKNESSSSIAGNTTTSANSSNSTTARNTETDVINGIIGETTQSMSNK